MDEEKDFAEDMQDAEPVMTPEDEADLGVDKEMIAALINPIEKGRYPVELIDLDKNEKGQYTFSATTGKLYIKPVFRTFTPDNEVTNGRFIRVIAVLGYRLFSQIDSVFDLVSGRRIDPKKVEAARRKVAMASVFIKVDKDGQYPPVNSISSIFPMRDTD